MQTGLVIEGGGMRGIYAAGALDVMMEHDIKADGVIGVSAGATHGCCYVSGQAGRSIRYYKKYVGDKHFMSFYSLFTTGEIVGKKLCYDEIPNRLDPYDYDAFVRSPIKFYATCTNVETGGSEYILCKDFREDMDYMRASASMPCVSKIVKVNGLKLLDGGIADSIPVAAFRKMGYKKNIVILTRPRNYRKKKESLLMTRILYRKYPNLVRAMAKRHENYNATLEYLERLERQGEVLVIAPTDSLKVSRIEKDIDKIQQMYDMGREDTLVALRRIQNFLG